ncbi:MAG: hypothetical protein QM775_25610 [Pirellulales bacterium]
MLDFAKQKQQIAEMMKNMPKAGGGGSGETILEKTKKILDDMVSAERDILSALGEQADLNKSRMTDRREELKLLEEMGVQYDNGHTELERINSRGEFQKAVIDEMTQSWRDQVKEIENVGKEIDDVTQNIEKERKSLEDTIKAINSGTAEDKVTKAADLVRERNEIRSKAGGGGGLSGDEAIAWVRSIPNSHGLIPRPGRTPKVLVR